jgi:hypothetical protein
VSWQELPQGQTFTLQPGMLYSVTASVKQTHTRADLVNFIQDQGLVLHELQDPAAGQAAPGYRVVAMQAQATRATQIPWAVPWYLPGDSSTLLHVWASPPENGNLQVNTQPGPTVWPWLVAVPALAGLGYLWWKRRGR